MERGCRFAAAPFSGRCRLVQLQRGSQGVLGGDFAGHDVLHIGEQVAAGFGSQQVLHGAGDGAHVGVGVSGGLLQGVEAGGLGAVLEGGDLGGDEGAQRLVGGEGFHELDRGDRSRPWW